MALSSSSSGSKWIHDSNASESESSDTSDSGLLLVRNHHVMSQGHARALSLSAANVHGEY